MPRKTKVPLPTLPTLPADLIDLFDSEPKTVQEINDTVLPLKKALIERAIFWGCGSKAPRARNSG